MSFTEKFKRERGPYLTLRTVKRNSTEIGWSFRGINPADTEMLPDSIDVKWSLSKNIIDENQGGLRGMSTTDRISSVTFIKFSLTSKRHAVTSTPS